MGKIKYTKEQVEEAVKNAINYSQVFKNLSMLVNGGSYSRIKSMILKYGINTDHFRKNNNPCCQTASIPYKERFKDEDISKDCRIAAGTLRSYLIYNGIKDECKTCGLTEWIGKPLRLDIDHLDGNPLNNRLDNLQFICPNCHRAKTITYEDGKFKGFQRGSRVSRVNFCKICSKRISNVSERCIACERINRKLTSSYKEKFDRNHVIDLISKNSILRASKILGISDNGLRKYCKRNGIDYKTISKSRKTEIY